MSARRRTRAKRGDGARLRDEIVGAAARLLEEHGDPGAVSIRALARALGVTPPALYLHFATKDDILGAAAGARLARLDAELVAAADHAPDAISALAEVAITFVRVASRQRALYEIAAGTDGARPGLDRLTAVARRCVAEGALDGEPEEIAWLLWCALHGLIVAGGAGGGAQAAEEEGLRRFVDVQVEGLLSV